MTGSRLNAVVDIISGFIFLLALFSGAVCTLTLPLGGGTGEVLAP